MRFFGQSRRKKSISMLPSAFSSSASLHTPCSRQDQEYELALPTKLDYVANSVHESAPQHLPGMNASQDDIRYFLYQILTLKDYNIARRSPQWVLETCMLWQGDGARLRSLPLDAFQRLCPLRPGFAVIDWTVKGSKFRPQDIPPCGIRDEIGNRVRDTVEVLRRKEEGHREPGWRNATRSMSTIGLSTARANDQNQFVQGYLENHLPSFGPAESRPKQTSFYSLGNHSMPVLQRLSSLPARQTSPSIYRQTSLDASQYVPRTAWPTQRVVRAEQNFQPIPSGEICSNEFPFPPSYSPISSYRQARSLSSQHTNSTAQTSPIGSENEEQYWVLGNSQSPSIAALRAGSQFGHPEPSASSPRHARASKPCRYKGTQQGPPIRLHDRSFNPARHLAHLRSQSYDSASAYASSETSLTPSDSATNKYNVRRDSVMPADVPQQKMSRRPSYPRSSTSPLYVSSKPQTFVTALPYGQSNDSSRPDIATLTAQNKSKLARPIKNYQVDAYALETAELIGCKSVAGPVRSMMAAERRQRKLVGNKSNRGFGIHDGEVSGNSNADDASVGPLLRFQNPRAGQPRLTMYETIEQHDLLGKQSLDNQRRVEMQRGRLKTVFETIEEQELLDGRPQRGMNTYASCEWSSYLSMHCKVK